MNKDKQTERPALLAMTLPAKTVEAVRIEAAVRRLRPRDIVAEALALYFKQKKEKHGKN